MCIHVTELEEELESCSDSEDVELESVDFLLRPLDFFAFLLLLPTFFFLFFLADVFVHSFKQTWSHCVLNLFFAVLVPDQVLGELLSTSQINNSK